MADWRTQQAEREKRLAAMPQISTWADIIAPALSSAAQAAQQPGVAPPGPDYTPLGPKELGSGIRSIPEAISQFLLRKQEVPWLSDAVRRGDEWGNEFMAGLTGEQPAAPPVSQMDRPAPAAGRHGNYYPEPPPEPMGPPRPGPGDPHSLGVPYNPPKMNVPKAEEIPYQDRSGIQQQLEALRPKPPELLSQQDMVLSVLGGLAAGAAHAGSGAKFGSILAGAGAAGIGAQQGVKAENLRRTSEFEDQQREQGLLEVQSNAQDLAARYGVDVKNIEARNQQRAQEAVADYEYEKAVQPQFHVGPQGTTVLWRDPQTGMMQQKETVSPQFALDWITKQAAVKAAAIHRLSGGKVDAKVTIPNIGEVDMSTLGPMGHMALAAKAWAGYAGGQEADALLQDVLNDPEKYGAVGVGMRIAKPKEQQEWAYKKVAENRLMKMIELRNTGRGDEAAAMIEDGLQYVSDYQTIMQNRAVPPGMLQQEASAAGGDDPMMNWMTGLVPGQ